LTQTESITRHHLVGD